jgi:predicted nucleotidyltransferase
VSDLLVAGSLATGDYVPGVSDLDLVALTAGPVGPEGQQILTGVHRDLDRGAAEGLDLGCAYVDAGTSPRTRTALIAWRDARTTVAAARRQGARA